MSELRTYLFIPNRKDLDDSYVAVKEAYINDNIADKTERVGVYGILFTSEMEYSDVRDKIRIKPGERHLLIEITGNITAESIFGFFPDTDIEELKGLNLDNLKDSAHWIERELERAVASQNYEKAAKLRDELKKKKDD